MEWSKGPGGSRWLFSFFCSIAKALYGVDGMRSYLDFCFLIHSFVCLFSLIEGQRWPGRGPVITHTNIIMSLGRERRVHRSASDALKQRGARYA
jgi:hypothetical protein